MGGRDIFRQRAARFLAPLVLVNVAAWIAAGFAFADHPALMGTALLAWVFGLRHAVDADHIAAIDNSVRKLMQDGGQPMGVGTWFALGHSTVVVLASLALACAITGMGEAFDGMREIGGLIGTLASGGFLLLLAAVNVAILRSVWRSFQALRRGVPDSATDPATGGLITRLLRPLFRLVRRSWHLFPVGVLFGLGFDTATEIGLLGMSAAEAARGLSVWRVMVFPALFTAGMALVDTADSVLMVQAYGWAFHDPLRKLWYNLTITATSVVVAVLIGGMELLGLLADKLSLSGGVWSMIASLNADMTNFGFVVVAVFALSWAVSAAVYRWRVA